MAQLLLLVGLALVQCGAAWRARDETPVRFTAVTLLAAALAATTAAIAVTAGATATWLVWAVTVDATFRSIVIAWIALGQSAAAIGGWLGNRIA